MGNCIRSLLKRLQKRRLSEKIIIILIVGLDNAGKTSILNRISGDSDKNVLPTIGFRTVSLKYKSYTVKLYDIGGNSQIRSLWTKYYSGIHGLIYVVDASDISRLTENKVVFGELISHECISGKPLLLLANKQDVNGAIDELDLVENLDIEHAANTMKCPTRVEICSCIEGESQLKDSTIGIKNGYKWLLDTIVRNYNVLNNKLKDAQNNQTVRMTEIQDTVSDTSSRISIHSNPFKPIKDLVAKKEEILPTNVSHNGVVGRNKLNKIFMHRNKTAPLTTEESVIELGDVSGNSKLASKNFDVHENVQNLSQTLNPVILNAFSNTVTSKSNRPYTAPGRSQHFFNKVTVINIPGQVTQECIYIYIIHF
ncbi:ADP-ribosylation factor-like protein 13B [Dufourea novaeangliae]|uniref:ADP-ribosylation factor-like protein 13B n=1 Tax=Dufourea novaeangliae TaxID=178035 RepID=A0A154PDB6_DUFNO|nr:ADP-ribosylation factor-like protein 13B [Dufourea novaeangliae]